MYLGNEYTLVEKPAIDYFKEDLGYRYLKGEEVGPESGERDTYREVILGRTLRESLKKLNPWMDDTSLNTAVRRLKSTESQGRSLLEINERVYKDIVDLEYTIKQSIDGVKKDRTVKYIDFENIYDNDFLIVNQYEVKGVENTIFPDLVVFINGIPIAVIEAKSPFKDTESNVKVGKKDGYEQLRRYMSLRDGGEREGAQRLFHTNFLSAIVNKYNGYVGTISSSYDYFLEWKDPYPYRKRDIARVEDNGQNLLFKGVFDKANLLNIMENFIIFEVEGSRKVKKLARYQQYRACMKAFERIKSGKTPIEKGGVIWHTQGSGKSLSMVMLSRMIRRSKELRDATIVVVTDRIDLDRQIYDTFAAVYPRDYTRGSNLTKLLTRAKTVSEMKELLSLAQPRIVMTTIHKFQCEKDNSAILEDEKQGSLFFDKEIEVLTNKGNVMVFTDEAHRSQYSNLSMNMRKALPNATFIGFTGTPIEKDDKSTYRTFGSLIDKYTISEAVEDGNTVAIVYEGRKQDLHIIQDELDEDFKEYFKDRSDSEKEAIKEKYFNRLSLSEADSRIDSIAKDMLAHYRDNSYKLGFKAQLVTTSRRACVKYYDALNKYMKEVFDEPIEVKVIYSADNNDPPYIKEHRTSKTEQSEIIGRFKKDIEEDRLCILIVKDMLLTGFDAKVEDVMYLDRPLKEHTLLQAIARVNRTYDKEIDSIDEEGRHIKKRRTKFYGKVVDYYGITKHLEDALKVFDKDDLDEPMEDIGALYNKMQDYMSKVLGMFDGVDRNNIDEVMGVLEKDNKRAEFEWGYKKFASAVNALMPTHVGKEELDTLKWLSYVRAGAKVRFEPEDSIDISDCGEKARELIAKHLETKGVYQWIKPITLFDKDFASKVNGDSDKATASTMEHAAKHAITVKMEENPKHYQSLWEKLMQILKETENNWVERKKQLDEFINRELKESESNKVEEIGLENRKQLALYDAVEETIVEGTGSYNIDKTKEIALGIEYAIKDSRVKGFSTNSTRVEEVKNRIFSDLLAEHYDELGYEGASKVTERAINIAKIHYDDDME